MKGPPDRWTGQMMVPPDHELEERLDDSARRQPVPADLASRVYRASVVLLAGRSTHPGRLRRPSRGLDLRRRRRRRPHRRR